MFRIVHTLKGTAAMMGFPFASGPSNRGPSFRTAGPSGESLREEEKDAVYGLLKRSAGLFKAELKKIGASKPLCTDIGNFTEEINTFTHKIKPSAGGTADKNFPICPTHVFFRTAYGFFSKTIWARNRSGR